MIPESKDAFNCKAHHLDLPSRPETKEASTVVARLTVDLLVVDLEIWKRGFRKACTPWNNGPSMKIQIWNVK